MGITNAAIALNKSLEEINLRGEIVVTIPANEWSRFVYAIGKELSWMSLYEDENYGNFMEMKIADIIFRNSHG